MSILKEKLNRILGKDFNKNRRKEKEAQQPQVKKKMATSTSSQTNNKELLLDDNNHTSMNNNNNKQTFTKKQIIKQIIKQDNDQPTSLHSDNLKEMNQLHKVSNQKNRKKKNLNNNKSLTKQSNNKTNNNKTTWFYNDRIDKTDKTVEEENYKEEHVMLQQHSNQILNQCFNSFIQTMKVPYIKHHLLLSKKEITLTQLDIKDSDKILSNHYKLITPTILSNFEHLYIFDFDGTLYETLVPDIGIPLYKKLYNKPWPYENNSWWSRKESISSFLTKEEDEEEIVAEGEALAKYLKTKKENVSNILVILLTGRVCTLKDVVYNFLESRLGDKALLPEIMCFKPESKYYINTIDFKIRQIFSFCNCLPNLKSIQLWEDRVEHARRFSTLNVRNRFLESKVDVHVHLVGKEAALNALEEKEDKSTLFRKEEKGYAVKAIEIKDQLLEPNVKEVDERVYLNKKKKNKNK
ncbi:hypothetical protein ABK040_013462 [Willaertia magna]